MDRRECAGEVCSLFLFCKRSTEFFRDLIEVRIYPVERAIFPEEILCFLRSKSRNSRYIVGRISDDGEIVDDLIGSNCKLCQDRIMIEDLLLHRVVDPYMSIIHELTEVFIG